MSNPLQGRHPGTISIMRWFKSDHLPERLRAVSQPCADLAADMVNAIPDGPELTAGLRKLLEAKDCFVRAELDRTGERVIASSAPAVKEERHGWTDHGYPCCDKVGHDNPHGATARCGGPAICAQCATQVISTHWSGK